MTTPWPIKSPMPVGASCWRSRRCCDAVPPLFPSALRYDAAGQFFFTIDNKKSEYMP